LDDYAKLNDMESLLLSNENTFLVENPDELNELDKETQ
jgi:hypothetical protein